MRGIVTYFIGVLLFVANSSAQTDSTSYLDSWIPKEMKGETLFVEKYSELSTAESISIASIYHKSAKKKRDECLQNIYVYNLVFRRKINTEIASVFSKYELDNIQIASTRDIHENLENDIRFVLKSEFSSRDLVKGEDYVPRYFIYDQLNDLRYKSFWSLDATLETLESFSWYANNRILDGTTQASVDDYVNRHVPNEPRRRSRMSRKAKGTLIALLSFGGLFITNAIIELN